ncbi:hypothetical protein COOONC_14715, partial [Cooperia oncophora]
MKPWEKHPFQEKDPRKSTLAKVVPTPNNGWAELVPLRRTQRAGSTKIWFEFQKVHYTLDEATNTFSTVVFDARRPMRYYQQSRGIESDDQLGEVKYLLGDNQLVFLFVLLLIAV